MRRWVFVLLAAGVMAACSEKPQTNESKRKADAHAYEGAASAFTANGWKTGNEASWEQQMKSRAQGQNEYSRIAQ